MAEPDVRNARGAFADALEKTIAQWGLSISPEQMDLLFGHYVLMIEANRTRNLTRITDPVEAAVKHYGDALALLPAVGARCKEVQRVLDVGTGAGLPAIPLAVMQPDWRVTAIDGTGKKVDFLTGAIAALNIKNLRAVHARSEHWDAGETFDMVALRAVAPLAKCIAQASRHVAKGGLLVAYKTVPLADEEVEASEIECRKRGLLAVGGFDYTLPVGSTSAQRRVHLFKRD